MQKTSVYPPPSTPLVGSEPTTYRYIHTYVRTYSLAWCMSQFVLIRIYIWKILVLPPCPELYDADCLDSHALIYTLEGSAILRAPMGTIDFPTAHAV
jgi:hypothetical protein